MYLSKITLHPSRAATRILLGSRHKIHATLMQCFSEEELRNHQSRILWRQENDGRDPIILIQSPTPPDFTHVIETYTRPTSPTATITKPYGTVLESLTEGQKIKWKIELNPTINKNGKRIPIYPAQTEEWTTNKLSPHGLSIQQLTTTPAQNITFIRNHRRITLASTIAIGTATITNPTELRNAITTGIGKAKGYGFGMLSIGNN